MAGDEFQSLGDMTKEPLKRPIETQLVGKVFFRLDGCFFTLRQSFWDRASKDSRDHRASCWCILAELSMNDLFQPYPIPGAREARDCSPSELILSPAQQVQQR